MRIEVLSQYNFDERLKGIGIDDSNVENDGKTAYISIIGTPECLTYYLDEGNTKHYLKDHPNVLNLDFDDIGDDVMYNGHHFKTLTMEQAEKTVDFVDKMIENGVCYILVHCRAGMSRSRAFAEFISRYCEDNNIELDYNERNDYTTMFNYGVLNRLMHAYWKKHRMNGYEEDNVEYPEEFINPKVIVIDR